MRDVIKFVGVLPLCFASSLKPSTLLLLQINLRSKILHSVECVNGSDA